LVGLIGGEFTLRRATRREPPAQRPWRGQ